MEGRAEVVLDTLWRPQDQEAEPGICQKRGVEGKMGGNPQVEQNRGGVPLPRENTTSTRCQEPSVLHLYENGDLF